MYVGRQILPLVDVQTQSELKAEIGALQEAWEQSSGLIVKRKTLSETVIQVSNHPPHPPTPTVELILRLYYAVIQTNVDIDVKNGFRSYMLNFLKCHVDADILQQKGGP